MKDQNWNPGGINLVVVVGDGSTGLAKLILMKKYHMET